MSEYIETEEKRNSYRINKDNIVLMITWYCNFSCDNCIANCSKKQAPSKEMMPLEKIEFFISDTIENKKKYNRVLLCGGEPTLHPQFKEICVLLKKTNDEYHFTETLMLTSNGYAQRTKEMIAFAQSLGFDLDCSHKSIGQLKGELKWRWVPLNIAPIDVGYTDEAMGNGCYQSEVCGLCYDSKGYWGCPNGATLARTFPFEPACSSIKDLTDEKIKETWKEHCRLCGAAFKIPIVTSDEIHHCDPNAPIDVVTTPPTGRVINQAMSKTWVDAFAKYKERE